MRGRCHPQLSMLAFVDLDARIPPDHPLRTVRRLADRALAELSPVFDRMYAAGGRPSIPPERLLKASLLIALYSVRSERAFCEELEYHLLYRWFLDIGLVDPGFDPSSFATASPKTASGCSGTRSPSGSSTRWCLRPTGWGCSRMRTSRWTAR